jgi:hypothetical protein
LPWPAATGYATAKAACPGRRGLCRKGVSRLAAILSAFGLLVGFLLPAILLDPLPVGDSLRRATARTMASPAFPTTAVIALMVLVPLAFFAAGLIHVNSGLGTLVAVVLSLLVGIGAGLVLTPAA